MILGAIWKEIKSNEKLLDDLKRNLLFWDTHIHEGINTKLYFIACNYVDIFLFFTGTLIFWSKHCQLHGNWSLSFLMTSSIIKQ